MAITLEEATEATDEALKQCIEEINEDPNNNQKEKDRLIDILLETREKSITTLMAMAPPEEEKLRRFQTERKLLIKP